jgi:hypothetical protein
MPVGDQDTLHPVLLSQSSPAQTTPSDNAAKRAAEKARRAQTIKFSFWLRRYEAWRAKQTGGDRLVLSPQSDPAPTAVTSNDNPIVTKKAAKKAAEKAVRDQTVKFGFWLRREMRYEAWRSKQTGGDPRLFWWFREPRTFAGMSFEAYFPSNAYLFGDMVCEGLRPYIPHLTLRLQSLIDSEEPFLVIRGVFSRRFLKGNLLKYDSEEAKRLLEKRHYDLVASALIAATKTQMRLKADTDTPYRDYFTEVSAEINQFDDRPDMHLRWRTATPELPPDTAGPNTAARIIVFACIENPIADPIYVIRAEDVIREMSAENKGLLYEQNFDIFNRWTSDILMQQGPGSNKRILHPKTDWLSFDPNKVCPAKMDAIHNAALGALLESIRKVAATKARKIILRRGDALIVHNYRALTRRQEHGYSSFFNNPGWMRGTPPIRWLRVYYGFPPLKQMSRSH